jgi:hypothetical protein
MCELYLLGRCPHHIQNFRLAPHLCHRANRKAVPNLFSANRCVMLMTSAKTSKNNNLPGMMNKIESKIENIHNSYNPQCCFLQKMK